VAETSAGRYLINRLLRPSPRVAQGLLLRGRATACIDLSDGLAADLRHVCDAGGVGAELEAERLPASSALLGASDGAERWSLQLTGGDDYELCFTVADADCADLLAALSRSGCAATRIGRIVAGRGVRVRDGAGEEITLEQPGWEHFRT
jgi:thiamine-monophosphate kinase